jgi:hypothetical protein
MTQGFPELGQLQMFFERIRSTVITGIKQSKPQKTDAKPTELFL